MALVGSLSAARASCGMNASVDTTARSKAFGICMAGKVVARSVLAQAQAKGNRLFRQTYLWKMPRNAGKEKGRTTGPAFSHTPHREQPKCSNNVLRLPGNP